MSGTTIENYTDSIVTYTVPATGLHDITALGGSGGNGFDGAVGGLGADVSGDFMLTRARR